MVSSYNSVRLYITAHNLTTLGNKIDVAAIQNGTSVRVYITARNLTTLGNKTDVAAIRYDRRSRST